MKKRYVELTNANKLLYFQNEAKGKQVMKLTISTLADITERKKEEENIRRLTAIIEFSDDAIISKSLDGTIKSWNRGGEKMFGYMAKEAIGKNISLIIPPEYIQEEKNILERICNNEIIDHYETMRLKSNGERFNVAITISPLRDRSGNIVGISKIVRDITFRKKSEEQLIQINKKLVFQNKEKEKRAAELIIANIELAVQNEEKGKRASELIIANRELAYQNTEKSKRASELVIANTELAYQNTEKSKRASELLIANKELVFQNKEKENRAAELIIANKELVFQNKEKEKRASELVIANKELAFQNSEKGKRAAELLNAYEEKNIILESIRDGFYALDKNWVITYWNKEAETLLGKKREEVIGKSIWEVYPETIDTIAFANYHNAVKYNTVQHYERFNETLNHWAEISAYPSPNGLSVYFKDITQRKLAELERMKMIEDMVQRNKDLEQFSYIVSHNLRAPVANIIGLAQVLDLDTDDIESKEMFNKGLSAAIKQLDSVIIDLNTILQVKNEITEKKEVVNLSELIDNIQSSIHNLVEKENVQIKTDFMEVSELNTITTYLHSIFYNLILNSIKYRQSQLDPLIEIKSMKSNGGVIITFKDNGMGIDIGKYGDKVFGLYKRFHQNIEGKGMGLFMVKTQVETLGGRITLNSEINRGTEFIIRFEL